MTVVGGLGCASGGVSPPGLEGGHGLVSIQQFVYVR